MFAEMSAEILQRMQYLEELDRVDREDGTDRMVPGGILIADNAINHYKTLKPMIEEVLDDPDFDAMVLPLGKGELYCRKKELRVKA